MTENLKFDLYLGAKHLARKYIFFKFTQEAHMQV